MISESKKTMKPTEADMEEELPLVISSSHRLHTSTGF